jgi:hypothetical protein
LYLDQQPIDTTTPMGKLVVPLTGVFAGFERTMIRQRLEAGLKRQSTKRDPLAGNPLPTCAREGGHGVDVFGDNTPVHNRLCFYARHCVGDVGAPRRQRSANNHSENQAHVTFPQCFAKRW